MESRTNTVDPPPTPEEIRRQLGWDMLPRAYRPDNGGPECIE
jgi:hypothetical protein